MKTGFLSLLTLLFIGLKLGAIISWSWLWVLSPLWLPWLSAVVLLLMLILFGQKELVMEAIEERKKAKERFK